MLQTFKIMKSKIELVAATTVVAATLAAIIIFVVSIVKENTTMMLITVMCMGILTGVAYICKTVFE